MMNDDEIMVWFGFPICRLLSLVFGNTGVESYCCARIIVLVADGRGRAD